MAAKARFAGSCVLALGIWLGLIGAYTYVAYERLHDKGGAAAVGILGGTAAAMVVSSVVGLFTSGSDRRAIQRAMNMEPRKDGRLEAASGPIRALGAPIETPFTGQPCVIYDYDIKPNRKGASDYAGYALAPCAVDTPQGPAKVLGWVTLDEFPAAPDSRIDRNRAVAYLSSVPLETVGLPGLLRAFKNLVSDDDGSIRKDFKIGGDTVNLQGRVILERSIAVGAVVTILGHWSESRGGFPSGGPAALNRLFAGDLEATRKRTGGSALGTLGMALVFFFLLHALLVPMYFMAPQGASGSVWDERDCDVQKSKLSHGANPNEAGTDAITPLMNAARMDDVACVQNLIAAGARLDDRDKFGDTALVQAVKANREDIAKVLLAAGAKEFRVTSATGRAIKDGDAPLQAVRDYIEAVHKGDLEGMARVLAHVTVLKLEDQRDNLSFWQGRLPKTFTVIDGWMNDKAATLTIRGDTPAGPQRVFFHLETVRDYSAGRSAAAEADPSRDAWQIRSEWHPDER